MQATLEDIQRYIGGLWLESRMLTEQLIERSREVEQLRSENEKLRTQNDELVQMLASEAEEA